MGEIYIIIVTYNGMQWLPKCLKATTPFAVIIVDNNSTDGTVSFVKNNFPKVILLEQEKNLGFGQANNLGISHALQQGADYVFLLNQDAYLELGSLEKLIAVQKENKNYGILSPIHLNGKGTRLDGNFSDYLSYSKNKDFYSDYILKKDKKEVYGVPFVNAAGWLITKECLLKVGGFDPLFFHYGEDENYCQRARFHQFKIGIVPEVFLRHDREERAKPTFEFDSSAYWENIIRSHKVLYANVGKNQLEVLQDSLRNRKTSLIKSYIKLNFKAAKKYKKQAKMLEALLPAIKKSLSVNKSAGPHYLQF